MGVPRPDNSWSKQTSDYAAGRSRSDLPHFAGSVARTGAVSLAIIERGPSARSPIGRADVGRSGARSAAHVSERVEAASSMSFNGTPASRGAVIKLCRSECGEIFLSNPARLAKRRTIRAAPAVAVEALGAVEVQKDRSAGAFADVQIQSAYGSWAEGMVAVLWRLWCMNKVLCG